MNILILEDDPEAAHRLVTFLKHYGRENGVKILHGTEGKIGSCGIESVLCSRLMRKLSIMFCGDIEKQM